MERHVWVLLGWSPQVGAAVTPVGVLGADDHAEIFVEWVPREHTAGRIWRERLAAADPRTLVERMSAWAETGVAPAVPVEPITVDTALEEAVRAQVDDILGWAR
ncbi:MAG TPA: hypothetical protein VG674_17740 [Amycolatopsis sp.]|nr:hypothetical protein [Amycolatopsis sp.]